MATLLDENEVEKRLETLNHTAAKPWTAASGKLSRVFRFGDFVEAFRFMTEVAQAAERLNHHPEWFNVYATVEVALSTHDAGGITVLDFELADAMERAAG